MDFSALSETWKERLKSNFTQRELELMYDYFDFIEKDGKLEFWIHTNIDRYKILSLDFIEDNILRLILINSYLTTNTIDVKLNDFYEIFEKRSLFE